MNVNVPKVAVVVSSGAGVIVTELPAVVTEGSCNTDFEVVTPVSQTMENDVSSVITHTQGDVPSEITDTQGDVPSVITDTQGDGGEGVGGSRGAPDYVELPDEDGGRD